MIVLLRIVFVLVVVGMLALITWSSFDTPLFKIPPEVVGHPWFVTTLVDAYLAFFAFFVWVAWKERGVLAGVLWFGVLMLLGNVAIGAYMLGELFRVESNASLSDIMTRRNSGGLVFPGVLAAFAVGIYLLA